MNKIVFILAACLILIHNSTWANELRCQNVFAEAVHFEGCYRDGMCPDNIYYLIKNITEQNKFHSFKNAKVLYFYSRWTGDYRYHLSETSFKPLRTRTGAEKTWHFHVVLLNDGLIYDFDHNTENKAVPVHEYLKQMFGSYHQEKDGIIAYKEDVQQYYLEGFDQPTPAAGSRQRMHVSAIPADVYLNEYSFDRNWRMDSETKGYAHWVHGDPRYSDQTFEEFIEKL